LGDPGASGANKTRALALGEPAGEFDIWAGVDKIQAEGSLAMKSFLKTMLTVLAVTSAFLLGFNFGRSKEKAKIPEFQ